MDLTITRKNRVICEECWNVDDSNANSGNTFLASTKIELHVGDTVMTEALGIDITLEGKKYKIFDVDRIVSKVDLKGERQ